MVKLSFACETFALPKKPIVSNPKNMNNLFYAITKSILLRHQRAKKEDIPETNGDVPK